MAQKTIDFENDILGPIGSLKSDLVDLGGEIDSTDNRVNKNSKNIANNKNDISEIQMILDSLTELKEVVLTDENEKAILTEQGELLTALIRLVKTDSTLLNEFLPANSKAVGDKIEYEANRIRAETQVDYSQFGLPTLYLNGDVTNISKDNKKTLSYEFKGMKGTCTCKWQGSSSLAYPKKNYTITFDNAFKVVDRWGTQKKYCLKANWVDFSHARNVVSAKLWGIIVRDRHSELSELEDEHGNALTTESGYAITGYEDFFLTLPNGGAVDGFPCVIYLNDNFLGLYAWNVPKDAWMMGMGNSVTEYMVTAEDHKSSTEFYETALLDGTDFDIEYKDDSVDSDTVKTSLNTMLQAAVNCNSAEDYVILNNYLDMNSAIDYYIFSALLCNSDGVDKNYILATYDGVKWFFTAYDLDTVFGTSWNGKKYVSYSDTPTINSFNNKISSIIRYFAKSELVNRFNELTSGILSEDNIQMMFNNYIANIPVSVKNADADLWKTIPATLTNNVEQIINYYSHRLLIITNQINNL